MAPTSRLRLGATLLRFLLLSAASIGVGTAFYGSSVFVFDRWPVQFLSSGITGGLFYAALKISRPRDGMAALLLWYLLQTLLVGELNGWIFILAATYIVGIALAVWLAWTLAQRGVVRGVAQRFAAMVVMVGILNALIIVVLSLFSFRHSLTHLWNILGAMYQNLRAGTLIGFGLGIGSELSEYLLSLPLVQRAFTGLPSTPAICPFCGEALELSAAELEAKEFTCPTCGKTTQRSASP
jgi:hypothetical protein